MIEVVSVTKKGQATIPKRLREKYGIKNKVIFEENECGLVLKTSAYPRRFIRLIQSICKRQDGTPVDRRKADAKNMPKRSA